MRALSWLKSSKGEAGLVAATVMIAYAVLRFSPLVAVGAFHDDAIYLALGKAIASGEGYRSIYAVGQPVHLKYPPGLPLIYATLWAVHGSLGFVAAAARGLALVTCGAAAGVIWWLARTRLGLHRIHAAVWAVGPFLLEGSIQYFNLPIAEPYFMLGWAAALCLYYAVNGRTAARQQVPLAAALGLVLAATTLLRMQAIVMIPAFLLAMALERIRWRSVAACAVAATLPIVTWRLIHAGLAARGPISTQPDELPYTAWLQVESLGSLASFLGRAISYNWLAYWDGFPGYVSDLASAGTAILGLSGALALGGGVLLLRRHPAIVLSVAATVAIIMCWPWPQDRFVLAFVPFAGLLVGAAVQSALARCHARLRLAGYATLGLLVLSIGERQAFIRSLAYGEDDPREILGFNSAGYFLLDNSKFLLTVTGWVRERTEPAERLLVDSPAAIYLYTGRRGVAATPAESRIVPSVFDTPGRYLASRIRDDGITMVVLGSVVRHEFIRDVAAFYQRCPGLIQYVGPAQEWSVALFYRVVRNDPCMTEHFLKE